MLATASISTVVGDSMLTNAPRSGAPDSSVVLNLLSNMRIAARAPEESSILGVAPGGHASSLPLQRTTCRDIAPGGIRLADEKQLEKWTTTARF